MDLFSPAPFTFSNEEEEPQLELAGFLGESLNAFHAGLSEADVERELASHCVGVTAGPRAMCPTPSTRRAWSWMRRTRLLRRRAQDFIERHAGSEDPVTRSRVVFV